MAHGGKTHTKKSAQTVGFSPPPYERVKSFLSGRPPFAPFLRAVAARAGDFVDAALRAAALAVTTPRNSGSISATEKSISSCADRQRELHWEGRR